MKWLTKEHLVAFTAWLLIAVFSVVVSLGITAIVIYMVRR